MPEKRESYNPLLKSYPDSEKVNAVSLGAETLFVRLIAQCDDYAHYYGDPKMITAKLFTQRMVKGEVDFQIVAGWLNELVEQELVTRFVVDGKTYIEIVNCRKSLRSDVKRDERFPRPKHGGFEGFPDEEQIRPESVTDAARTRDDHVTLTQPNPTQPKSTKVAAQRRPAAPDAPACGKAKTRPKQPSGDHAELVAFFCEGWQQRFGDTYAFQNAKDGAAAKRILKTRGIEKAKQIVSAYLDDDDPFIVKTGHTLAVLASQLNRYLAQGHHSANGSGNGDYLAPPREPDEADLACIRAGGDA